MFTRPLICEYSLVREDDLSKLNPAFFAMNGVISVVLLIFVLLDRLVSQ
jgi:4-hydroxybenzoate polyprenyltransferase